MTIKQMKERALAAWNTMRNLTVGRVGPSLSLGYWPEYILDYPVARQFKRIPSAEEISDAEDFQRLVIVRLTEQERKDVWKWCSLKWRSEKSSSIRGHCDKFGLKEHNYRRHIDKIFQKLAGNQKSVPNVRSFAGVDVTRKTSKLGTQSDVICTDGIKAWRPESSKPVHDPNVREIALRAIKKQRVGP